MTPGNEHVWNKLTAIPGGPEPSGRPQPRRTGPPAPAAKGISYGQLARSHKFVLLGFVALGAIAGLVRVTLTIPLYQAATTVQFNEGLQGMSQQSANPATTLAASISTQIAILTSRTLVSRVVARMNLELTPQLSAPNTKFTKIRDRIPFLRQDPLLQSRQAVGVAASTVGAKAVIGTQIIQIQCTSTSPEVAASFVNTLAGEYQASAQASRLNQTQQASQWTDSQVEESKTRLQEANDRLRTFVQKSGMDLFPQQSTLAESKMATLRLNVAAAQATRVQKESLWELAKNTPPENLPDVTSDTALQNLKAAINEQHRELAQLLTKYTPQDPHLQKVQLQIKELEKDLQMAEASLLKRLQSDSEEAATQEKKLTAAYNTQTHSVSAQSDKSAEYTMLIREVDTDQQLYNNLLQQSNQATLMALAPSGNIRVVDAAYPDFFPFSPNPRKDITVWALGGGVLGYGLLLLVEVARRKRLEKLFDSPGYTQTILGVPELGVIPSTQAPKPVRKALFGVSGRRSQPSGATVGLGLAVGSETNGSTPSVPVAGSGEWSSMLSESFRQTLVSLLRTKPRGHNPVYVITSAGVGEGKTTLSANLARAMAEIGQRVLLVDADLRRPHVHSLLGLGDHPGLSDILAGPDELQDLLIDNYILQTPIENLSVMTHGKTKSETPLFFSPRVPEIVAFLQARYDCVLFDTAPALPFPDARLWGRHSDGVVLVVRAGVTTREGASAACERFLSDGIPVLGTILNDWTPNRGSELAYYYNRYQAAEPK